MCDSQNTITTLAMLENVSKRYGNVTALNGLSLSVHAGEILALLGPNGAGKTTAVSLLLNLIEADSGTVSLFNQDPQALAARQRIGVMLQSAELPETLRVAELIERSAQRARTRRAAFGRRGFKHQRDWHSAAFVRRHRAQLFKRSHR